MSQQFTEKDEATHSTQSQVGLKDEAEVPTILELTVENVQRLEQQFEGTEWLYSSSRNLEGYVEQCSQMDWEAGRIEEICKQDNNVSSEELDLRDHMRTASRDPCPRFDSPEYVEVYAFDGRVISRISTRTQTDWDWVDQRRHEERSQVNIQSEEVTPKPAEESGTPLECVDTTLDSTMLENLPKNEDLEIDMSLDNEVLDTLSKNPQTPTACRVETKQSPTPFEMIRRSSSSDSSGEMLESEMASIPCEYCLQPKKPTVTKDQIVNNMDQEELFCCELSWKMTTFLMEEKEEAAFAAIQGSREIDVSLYPPFKKAAKERVEQRLKEWENQNGLFSTKQRTKVNLRNTICYRLSNEVWTAEKEDSFAEMEIIDSPDTLTLYGEEQGHKIKHTLIKLYESGQSFVTIFPDGTGQVFYPSERLAVLIFAVHGADYTYVILEDKDLVPNIQAIFTSRGQATCYHPNGLIWVNLTQLGGSCCSDTGAMRRRWSWLDHEPHVHAPPFQPICLTLSPNISLRIQTQDCIYLTFTSRKRSVRFNVGAKLKLEHLKSLMLPGPDLDQRHLHMKSAEIYNLLQRIQGYITYQQAPSPQKVMPQYSLVSQMERLKTPLDKHHSVKKRVQIATKAK
ncbi:glutamate-rich protein 6 [Salmo salar]|uniref:Glutamate-rich protein 6 n=1 Tax=Salmo salar TaxID=8030 RepID=A0A1S3NWN2_SALSA|nr:glutamate-rich protein 6-like [Salmo salar]